ncbi:sensor histidine kinase [Thiocystis violascens]|uniref:histidine kinase n=1 Tax=Thiocystis violascens (strain ATCC 17096 / DSM 198 / 6111) TaxID=765911 RepID=I3YFL6_THIV6|nr:ATP-binding protein [Thiocystis violascens]AFL75784.1 signal transduction histidine kinase [Thiocystis violascens DSM 198]
MPLARRLPPPWLGHLLVFGLLFALVLGWFFVQTRQAQQVFLDDAGAHARLLTDAVILHARGALLAERVTADILTRFLGNSARFVLYLDDVAPFRADELAAFTAEAGLSVIRVVRADGAVQGPADWQPGEPLDCDRLDRLIRLTTAHTILFGVADARGGCVLVGLDSRHTEALEAAIGLPRALGSVADLPGVVNVRLEGEPHVEAATVAEPPRIAMRELADGLVVAEASAPVAGARLLLDLDAGPLLAMRARLWRQFLGFVLVLGLAGGIGAWILHRHQRAHERQLLDYERLLSRQREEAGLGRAAAAIAHEIRNPLNVMAMGLQRLQLEAEELHDEHRRLLDLVRQALRRANGTVGGLLDYARPLRPRRERIALDILVAEQLGLYRPHLAPEVIALDLQPATWASGDPDLLRQVLDNLLRNALEAAGDAGALEIRVWSGEDGAHLCVANDGLELDTREVECILEPWFTTRATGNGLGLAISQRIVIAHGGRLTLDVPRPGRLRANVALPAR